MNDIKVIDTLREIQSDQEWWNGKHSPIEFFAEAVARTRQEDETKGVSIRDIARCFKAQFDKAEVDLLIRELQTDVYRPSDVIDDLSRMVGLK